MNFEFDGEALLNGKQTAELLGYLNTRDALSKHVDDDLKYKVKNSDVVNRDFRKLNNAGETFISVDAVIDLTYKSQLPQAVDFRKKVRGMVKQVQKTGRYDAVENQIMEVEDEREKQLKLKLYKLEQLLEIDPNDRLIQIQLKDVEKDLLLHKQNKRLELVEENISSLTETVESVKEENKLIKEQQMFVCNRTNFDEKIRILANKYFGRKIQDAYKELFSKMKLLGSFDVYSRRKNEWEKINADRAKEGKKPYKPSTLKQHYNFLDVIDDYNKWELASEAYKTIETERTDLTLVG
ncbi:BRO family protein [Chengkuizengella marina]|uniref:BRO family protein n=1 Tax=Chengkuizengella marina TaxID=2507566 RepID=UPI0013702343|nr:Bro-N domain-containing protein [Chengkuizengella marina]